MSHRLAYIVGAMSQPPSKKQRFLISERDSAHLQYLSPIQPGRVPLREIGFHEMNRAGQGIVPMHVHALALDICRNGTSARRYGPVMLVEVPDGKKDAWLSANKQKWTCNPLMPRVETTPLYLACLSDTHFVHAHKLIAEGGRTYMNIKDGTPLNLIEDDIEGNMIREEGVVAIMYEKDLWDDKSALLALVGEANLHGVMNPAEAELDASGAVNAVRNEISQNTAGSAFCQRCGSRRIEFTGMP